MKKTTLLLTLTLYALFASAQAPTGYYNAAKGRSGTALRQALGDIITKGHKPVGYGNLEDVYKVADVRPDGCYWDMYSSISNFRSLNSGSNGEEGGMMNKEHSFPKSWFGGKVDPMYSDAFHVVPADAYCNNRRGNLPFGETSSPTWSSAGGFSKVGPCNATIGYTGKVFEPNDEYKGDFARIYFYMNTRYYKEFKNWDSPMLSGDGYTAWALKMLLRWSKEDPVSQKEIDRNNAVYSKQGNRNPFVDFPGLEDYIWGTATGFDPNNYGQGGGDDTQAPPAPTFDPASGEIEAGTKVYIECSDDDAYIYYSLNGGDEVEETNPVVLMINEATSIKARSGKDGHYSEYVSASYTVKTVDTEAPPAPAFSPAAGEVEAGTQVSITCEDEDAVICYSLNGGEEMQKAQPVVLTINETTSITARSEKQGHYSESVSATYTIAGGVPEPEEGTFSRVTSTAQLKDGGKYLIVCEEYEVAMGAQAAEGDIRTPIDVTIDGDAIDAETGGEGQARVLTLNAHSAGTYSFYDAVANAYLALTTDGNKLSSARTNTEDEAQWTIAIKADGAHIANVHYSDREIQYNLNHPRFACYKGGQQPVVLFVLNEAKTPSGIESVSVSTQTQTAYDLQGRCIKQGAKGGVYIVNGQKVILR